MANPSESRWSEWAGGARRCWPCCNPRRMTSWWSARSSPISTCAPALRRQGHRAFGRLCRCAVRSGGRGCGSGDAAFAARRPDRGGGGGGQAHLLRKAAGADQGRGRAARSPCAATRGWCWAWAMSGGWNRRWPTCWPWPMPATLGRIHQIEANFSHDKFLTLDRNNWRLKADQAPAGGMTATGIHLLDLSVRLLGAAESVLCICEQLSSDLPQGDTVAAYRQVQGRRHVLCLGLARQSLHLALCRLRLEGLDRHPRQGACRGPGWLDRDLGHGGRADHHGRNAARPNR